jgi:hypothetical protein
MHLIAGGPMPGGDEIRDGQRATWAGPVFTDAERVALAGFLAGYRGLTREAYALDLRQFAS